MIKLIDALNQMEATDRNGNMIPFQVGFYTKSGELIEIPRAVKCVGERGGQPVFSKHSEKSHKKSPDHFKNATRNIFIPESNQVRKLKIRLMVQFNGQDVCY